MSANIYPISDPITLWVGDKWAYLIPLTSRSGSITISAVSAKLRAEDSTTDVLSTYASGSAAFTGNNITTPLVGEGSSVIIPGKYTLFITVTFNGGLIITLTQDMEFLEVKG